MIHAKSIQMQMMQIANFFPVKWMLQFVTMQTVRSVRVATFPIHFPNSGHRTQKYFKTLNHKNVRTSHSKLPISDWIFSHNWMKLDILECISWDFLITHLMTVRCRFKFPKKTVHTIFKGFSLSILYDVEYYFCLCYFILFFNNRSLRCITKEQSVSLYA